MQSVPGLQSNGTKNDEFSQKLFKYLSVETARINKKEHYPWHIMSVSWTGVNTLIQNAVRLLPKHGLLTCVNSEWHEITCKPSSELKQNTLSTCDRTFSKCSISASFSFWHSDNLARVSDSESWVSRRVSISLSRSSSMLTINCSKFVSSFWP